MKTLGCWLEALVKEHNHGVIFIGTPSAYGAFQFLQRTLRIPASWVKSSCWFGCGCLFHLMRIFYLHPHLHHIPGMLCLFLPEKLHPALWNCLWPLGFWGQDRRYLLLYISLCFHLYSGSAGGNGFLLIGRHFNLIFRSSAKAFTITLSYFCLWT